MTTEKYYNKIIEVCLDVGERREAKVGEHDRVAKLYGLTGLRTKHFLNALLGSVTSKMTYLELGVYRGASLVCALYNNPHVKAYAVDNWHYSEIDTPSIKYDEKNNTVPWDNVRLAAIDNIEKYKINVKLLEKNWVDLKKSDIPEPVDIVHLQTVPGVTKEELTAILNSLYPLLEVTSIFIVELHKLDLIREGVNDWIKAKNIKIDSLQTKDSRSLYDGAAWWGGLGVYVITKQNITK